MDIITNLDLYNIVSDLKLACQSLRSCYAENASSVQEFVDLRRKVVNHATVYDKIILPIANIVIQNIQDSIKNYAELSYDDFKKSIKDLAATSHQYQNLTTYTLLLQQEFLTDFMSENINTVLKELEKDDTQVKEPRRWSSFMQFV